MLFSKLILSIMHIKNTLINGIKIVFLLLSLNSFSQSEYIKNNATLWLKTIPLQIVLVTITIAL